ncbi:MAG: membrane integrity-associated transporter subunit PqiC [Campylobacterales bacterium]|nr:membrane integrity-associated transporter subunit PqiC [Campylobacterales bacterium]
MKYIIWIAIFLFLQGCSVKSPLKVYTLHSDTSLKAYSDKFKDKTMKVAYPQGLKEKMGQNMQFSYSDIEHGSYQNSKWSNTVEQLLQGILIQTLQQSELFGGVFSYTSTVQADYRLESTIFDFSHRVRGNTSYAMVSIQFSLIDAKSGRMVKGKLFNYSIPTATTNAKGYVDAANIAINILNKDLITWLKV